MSLAAPPQLFLNATPEEVAAMGEVRVKVRLLNTVDEELAKRGGLAEDQVRSLDVEAIVDTGAARSVLPRSVADQLGLGIRNQRRAQMADGSVRAIDVVGPLTVVIHGRDTIEDATVMGDEVLIGQTVLESTDMLVPPPC